MASKSGVDRIGVYVVEDSTAIRTRYSAELRTMPHLELRGEATSAPAAIKGIRESSADLVILDLALEGSSGMDVLHSFPTGAAKPKFLVVTNNADPAIREHCLRSGAARFFDKSAGFLEMIDFLESLAPAGDDRN